MRRNLFSTILVAALVPAASLWAAPNTAAPSNQILSQITEQTYQLQIQADRLERYLRSGAHDSTYASGLTFEMAEGTLKLATLLDEFVSQPGTVNETRQQVDRMKVTVAELEAFVGGAAQNLDARSAALHSGDILASISNIMDRGNMLRTAARNLAIAN
jgi:hypothetical protein